MQEDEITSYADIESPSPFLYRKLIEVTDEMLLPMATTGSGVDARQAVIGDLQMELRFYPMLDFIVDNDDFWIVMREVLNNALDAVRGEIHKYIFLLFKRDGKDITISILNNGRGLNEGENKSFETHIGGFGSGLKVCRKKCEAMGATFSIEPLNDLTRVSISFQLE